MSTPGYTAPFLCIICTYSTIGFRRVRDRCVFFFFFFLFEYFVCIKFHYLWYCPSQRLVHGPSEITDCCEMEGVVHVLVEKFPSTIRDFEIVFALIQGFPFFFSIYSFSRCGFLISPCIQPWHQAASRQKTPLIWILANMYGLILNRPRLVIILGKTFVSTVVKYLANQYLYNHWTFVRCSFFRVSQSGR